MLDILKNNYYHYCQYIHKNIINKFIIWFYNFTFINLDTNEHIYKNKNKNKKNFNNNYKNKLRKNKSINNLIYNNDQLYTKNNNNLCEWGWFIFIDN